MSNAIKMGSIVAAAVALNGCKPSAPPTVTTKSLPPIAAHALSNPELKTCDVMYMTDDGHVELTTQTNEVSVVEFLGANKVLGSKSPISSISVYSPIPGYSSPLGQDVPSTAENIVRDRMHDPKNYEKWTVDVDRIRKLGGSLVQHIWTEDGNGMSIIIKRSHTKNDAPEIRPVEGDLVREMFVIPDTYLANHTDQEILDAMVQRMNTPGKNTDQKSQSSTLRTFPLDNDEIGTRDRMTVDPHGNVELTTQTNMVDVRMLSEAEVQLKDIKGAPSYLKHISPNAINSNISIYSPVPGHSLLLDDDSKALDVAKDRHNHPEGYEKWEVNLNTMRALDKMFHEDRKALKLGRILIQHSDIPVIVFAGGTLTLSDSYIASCCHTDVAKDQNAEDAGNVVKSIKDFIKMSLQGQTERDDKNMGPSPETMSYRSDWRSGLLALNDPKSRDSSIVR